MRKVKSVTLALSVMLLVLAGCGKYDDGPKFSMRSKQGRLVGTWKVEKTIFTMNGIVTETAGDGNAITKFEKNGNFKISITNETDLIGKWKFFGDDELELTYDSDPENPLIINILRLKHKELWLLETYNFLGTTATNESKLIPN